MTQDSTNKMCNKCKQIFDKSMFNKNNRNKDGLRYDCKNCCKEYKKEYYSKNKESILNKNKEWTKNNPDKNKKIKRNWQKRNKDYVNSQGHNRRAKIRSVEGKITRALIKLMLIEQNYKCAYCKCSIKEKYTLDHIQALSLGGNNMYENLAMSCESCNYSKGAKDLTEWAKYNGWIGGN